MASQAPAGPDRYEFDKAFPPPSPFKQRVAGADGQPVTCNECDGAGILPPVKPAVDGVACSACECTGDELEPKGTAWAYPRGVTIPRFYLRDNPQSEATFGPVRLADGMIAIGGATVDVTTSGGTADLRRAVSPADFAAIVQMLQLVEVNTATGPVLAPSPAARYPRDNARAADFGPVQVDDGLVTIGGVTVDVTTPAGTAKLRRAVSPADFAAILAQLQMMEINTAGGPVLAPSRITA